MHIMNGTAAALFHLTSVVQETSAATIIKCIGAGWQCDVTTQSVLCSQLLWVGIQQQALVVESGDWSLVAISVTAQF